MTLQSDEWQPWVESNVHSLTDDELPDEDSGAVLLGKVMAWYLRFLAFMEPTDAELLAVWTIHTHLAAECYTSPRLLIDSTLPGSGKTTMLDHLARLCQSAVLAASLSSPALLARLLESGIRSILIDETDRNLNPDNPNSSELLAVLNSGYRVGASRPTLVPVKGGSWEAREMSTFAPVAMAGNSPRLPDDTRSRCIRILLMPDIDGTVEDSDWEVIEDEARALAAEINEWASAVADQVKGRVVALPAGCTGRSKDKWRPLMRVAEVAGGFWPQRVTGLIVRDLEQDQAERENGLRSIPPGMLLLTHLHKHWPQGEDYVPTSTLVQRLVSSEPSSWGLASPYGKQLTETRFGRLIAQASKLTSTRPGGRGPRGFSRGQLDPVWYRLGIGREREPGASH